MTEAAEMEVSSEANIVALSKMINWANGLWPELLVLFGIPETSGDWKLYTDARIWKKSNGQTEPILPNMVETLTQ